MDALSRKTHAAVEALMQCHAACYAQACTVLLQSQEAGRPQHTRLLLDAAAITAATAQALSRKSQFQSQFAQLCIAICTTCAQDCEKSADAGACAKLCRGAAQACSELDQPDKADILAKASRVPPG